MKALRTPEILIKTAGFRGLAHISFSDEPQRFGQKASEKLMSQIGAAFSISVFLMKSVGVSVLLIGHEFFDVSAKVPQTHVHQGLQRFFLSSHCYIKT